jgi:succinate dehydrogenase / fumarate reductase cytochrome b subunit
MQQTGSDLGTTFNIIYESWIFQIIVIFIVIFHGLNGLRIIILDVWPSALRFQREALWLQWVIFVPVYGLTIFILVYTGLIGG